MTEIYRDFEGKLGVDNRSGHIVSAFDSYIIIESISVYTDTKDVKVFFKKTDRYNRKSMWSPELVRDALDYSISASISPVVFYRKLNKLTQRALATKAGIHINQVQKLESGEIKLGNMRYNTVTSLAAALGVDPDDLDYARQ